jgi:hypothetical protein
MGRTVAPAHGVRTGPEKQRCPWKVAQLPFIGRLWFHNGADFLRSVLLSPDFLSELRFNVVGTGNNG